MLDAIDIAGYVITADALLTQRELAHNLVRRDGARFAYGELRVDLQRRGSVIGPLDMLIAAHAIALDATLVTNNEREFKRVKGLRVENWVK